VVGGREYGGVDGASKKEAEQRAAETAWQELSEAEAAETADAVADGSDA